MKKWFDITDSDGIKKHLRESMRDSAFYDGDPQNGGVRIPRSQSPFWNDLVKIFTEVTGKTYVPTDDVEQMKSARTELYLRHLRETIERRKWNSSLESDEKYIIEFRYHWLEEEATNIARWKDETPSDRPEVIIEIEKYFKIVNNELTYIREGLPIEIYSKCTAETFRADLIELCHKCPWPKEIRSKIQRQIVFQAQQNKDILTKDQFTEYLNAEIKSGQETMKKMHLLELQSEDRADPYRSNRILIYIWNKERIKALNIFQADMIAKTSITEENSTVQIQTWEYRLRDFINVATRFSIDSVYAEVRPGFAFSVYFQDHVSGARTLFEQFRIALLNELNRLANPSFFGIDLRDRFLPMIYQYKEWYAKNKTATERFGEYNPYALMLNVIESTEKEILKYFPTTFGGESSVIVIPAKQPRTPEETRRIVRHTLSPLGGLSPQNQQIMPIGDYNRLIEYTDIIVSKEGLPDNIKPIPQTGISNEHIRYTFYRLHKILFGRRRKRQNFIPFIHAVFSQFEGTQPTTTNSKFSTPPKSYEKDFEGYIGEIE